MRALFFRIAGLFNPFVRDACASMDCISSGPQAADTALQSGQLGPLPSRGESLPRGLEQGVGRHAAAAVTLPATA